MIKSFKQMSMQEAITWTETNCMNPDLRHRQASKMVAYLFLSALREGTKYVEDLQGILLANKEVLEAAKVRIAFLEEQGSELRKELEYLKNRLK